VPEVVVGAPGVSSSRLRAVKLYGDYQPAGSLSPRLDPPHEAMGIFLGVGVPNRPVGHYLKVLASDEGRLGISFNVILLNGDRSITHVAEDDSFVPDTKQG
jgi:hypothetical protein